MATAMRERAALAGRRLRAGLPAVVVGGAAGFAAVAGSFAVAGLTPEFVVAPVARAMTVAMPGFVVTLAITLLGDLGDHLALASAVGLTAVLLGVPAMAGDALARRLDAPSLRAPFAVVAVGAVATPLAGALLSGLAAALGATVVTTLARFLPPESTDPDGRRSVLGGLAGAVGVGAVGLAVGLGRGGSTGVGGGGEPTSTPVGAEAALLAMARERSLRVEGLEPLVSESFYRVDINQVDPTPSAEEWTLSVTGAVESPLTIDYAALTAPEPEHRFVTLRCVGEDLNGHKLDNALWTGVPVADVLEGAGETGEYVMARAVDGYFEEFPTAALEDAFLAYGMNGRTLPRGHGHPVRLLVPGHWGEINVKWIDELEFLDEPAVGYWERRGWHGTGPVNTVAKLWVTNRLGDGRVEVAGAAYAGTRDIDRVEVSTDGGATWTAAELSEPLPGNDVWRQWVHRYDPPGGAHEVTVRAVDGTGAVQPSDRSGAFPSGPTGWVSTTVGG